VVLQFSGSTTLIGAIGDIAPHLLVLFNCKINLNFETLNTTYTVGVVLQLYNSTTPVGAIIPIPPIGVVL
jgi:hypothetical protein